MRILGSSFFWSSLFREWAWLRRTNEASILEKCAQRGAQDCTSIDVMSGSESVWRGSVKCFTAGERHYCYPHREVMPRVEMVVQFRDLHTCPWDQKDTGNDGLFYRIILSLYREISFFPNSHSLLPIELYSSMCNIRKLSL